MFTQTKRSIGNTVFTLALLAGVLTVGSPAVQASDYGVSVSNGTKSYTPPPPPPPRPRCHTAVCAVRG